ncbi:MAG TPA: hypothetical protein PKJ25_09915 [Smithellaceae bacterium]|jgi:hypothetical protein|nr:hypothetical protein [Smithellaceae bacterium]
MNAVGSSLPVVKPYFLSGKGYSDKNPGPFLRASGFLSPNNPSTENEIEQMEFKFSSEAVSSALAPILAFKSDQRWIDENSIIPVSGKKCSCKSVWCPVCFRSRFHNRIVEIFSPYDWQSTRHIILTVDPELYRSPSAALEDIRKRRFVGEFIRRLRRGVKVKIGSRWVWQYKPIDVLRWAWFLEFHKNGFPHYHVFIQTPVKGSAGMIGGDFLRDCWKIAKIVKETYFHNEGHFRQMTGYYADKGYFEKGKEYQGRLLEDILNNIKEKIKRMKSSEKRFQEKRKPTEEEIEEKNFKECMTFFDEKHGWSISDEEKNEFVSELEERIDDAEKREVNYRAIIANCGAKTYVELDIAGYRIAVICDVPWKKWKEKAGISYENNRGYISKLTKDEILELLASVVRVVSIKKYQDIDKAVRERLRQINNAKAWADSLYMRD